MIEITEISDPLIHSLLEAIAGVQPPSNYEKVYKDECMFSFDTPFSPGGLFVNLRTRQGFGAARVAADAARRAPAPAAYLHLRARKVRRPEAEAAAAAGGATELAIGTAGGFLTDDQKWETRTETALVLPPDGGGGGGGGGGGLGGWRRVPLPHPGVPEMVAAVVQGILDHAGAAAQADVDAWQANEEVPVSKYADALLQVDNGKRISPDPATWRCEESGLQENLWLNLSTGHIGSGRRNWDGTGGTGAALKHYEETGGLYPLVVKLGTITAAGADVYSYAPDEDCMVQDPKLAEHMAHWGINVMRLEKTEKTVAELEVALNKTYDFSKITEAGEDLRPLRGPNFCGMKNLGNSCYVNAVLQCLLATPELRLRYAGNAEHFFGTAPEDPAEDFLSMMAKVASALHSGAYCPAPEDAPEEERANEVVVAPRALKALVGRGHPEFASGRQQCALEYFQHLLDVMTAAERGAPARMGAGAAEGVRASERLFAFQTEDRLECPETRSVRYTAGPENTLLLDVPEEAAVNQAEVAAYRAAVAAREEAAAAAGTRPDLEGLEEVKPLVPWAACLERWAAPGAVEGYRSPLAGRAVTATKVQRFKTFPRYLVVQIKRYYLTETWEQKKKDVEVDMPETLSIDHLRSMGLQPSETPMPEDDEGGDAPMPDAAAAVEPDPDTVAMIMAMGFSEEQAKAACVKTNNAGAEAAMNAILSGDLDNPEPTAAAATPSSGELEADPGMVASLVAMGFSENGCRRACLATQNANVEVAMNWVLEHMGDPDFNDPPPPGFGAPPPAAAATAASSSGGNADAASPEEDGVGTYTLHGFVSHVGRNTASGHYVCHLRSADGSWAIFDDQKVAQSRAPPLRLGYLYFYRRDDAPAVEDP